MAKDHLRRRITKSPLTAGEKRPKSKRGKADGSNALSRSPAATLLTRSAAACSFQRPDEPAQDRERRLTAQSCSCVRPRRRKLALHS